MLTDNWTWTRRQGDRERMELYVVTIHEANPGRDQHQGKVHRALPAREVRERCRVAGTCPRTARTCR